MELSPEVRALVDAPNYAHISTLRKDGTPRNWVVWIGRQDDLLYICTGDHSWKARDLARDPRIGISINSLDNPFEMTQIQGRVVEVRPDPDNEMMNPLSHKYTGEDYPRIGPGRVCLFIEPVVVGHKVLGFTHAPA